jgi:hypothetical protein
MSYLRGEALARCITWLADRCAGLAELDGRRWWFKVPASKRRKGLVVTAVE